MYKRQLCTQRKFAFRKTVLSIFIVGIFGASGTKSAFIHFSPSAKISGLWILRSTEWTGIKAIPTPYALVFRVEDNALVGSVKTVHRTYSLARCI